MSSSAKFYLTKRKNGYYYIRIIDADGVSKYKTTRCTTKSAALTFLNSFKYEISKQHEIVIPLFSDYFNLFEMLNKGHLKPKTLLSYRQYAKLFLTRIGDKCLDCYSVAEFEKLRAEKLSDGWSLTSANIFTRSIKAIFGFACRQNLLEYNPLLKVKNLKQAKRTPAFLTLDELKQVIAKEDKPILKDIFYFTAFTGLRLGEVVNLKTEDVDLMKNRILVANTDEFTTKSGRERIVGIHPSLVELILRQPEGKYLFAKSSGYRFSESYVSHRFKQAFLKSGISKNIHFHSLRHTFASWAVANGIDIYTVQALLGHSSVAVTSIYSHLEKSTIVDAIKKLPS